MEVARGVASDLPRRAERICYEENETFYSTGPYSSDDRDGTGRLRKLELRKCSRHDGRCHRGGEDRGRNGSGSER